MGQPWTPPVGDEWNPVDLLLRLESPDPLTFPQGDQNKTDAESAINWIGERYFDTIVLQTGSYADPDWITSLAYSKLTGVPTALTFENGLTLVGSTVKFGGATHITQNTTLTIDTPNVLSIATSTATTRFDTSNFAFSSTASISEFNITNNLNTGYIAASVRNSDFDGIYFTTYGNSYISAGQLDIASTTQISSGIINWALPTPYTFNVWTGTVGSLVNNFRIEQDYTRSLNRFSFDTGIQLVPASSNFTTPYTVLSTDSVLFTTSATGNTTLPATSGLENGWTVVIQSGPGSTPTIVPDNPGTENIMGATSYVMQPNESVILIKYPLNWRIIGSFGSAVTTLTFNSGITKTGTTVQLGGSLLQSTSIVTNGNNFNFTQSSNQSVTIANNGEFYLTTNAGRTFEYNPTGYVSNPSIRINPGGSSFSAGAALHVRGSGTSSNMAFMVQNSTPNTLLSLSENGIATMGFRIDFNLAFGGGNLVQAVRALEFDTTLAPTSPYVYRFKQTIAYSTLTDWSHTLLEGNWALSSGANTATFLDIHPTLVQSGTHTGIIRGAYYRPVATLLGGADHRAWENTIGNVIVGSTSGSLGINRTAPLSSLDNGGSTALDITTSSAASLTLDSTATVWVFTGGSATAWTMTNSANRIHFIKNAGSAAITLTASSGNLYTTSSVASLVINAGESYIASYDLANTIWRIM